MPIPPPLPPPPPPAPPPPPPAFLLSQSEPPNPQRGEGGRSALLADIQKGTRLKKVTQVNDRSAPALNQPRAHSEDGNSGAGGSSGATPTQGPALSGLFAGGFPILRPVGQRDRGSNTRPVARSGSSASLKQPLWNLPSQGESFTGSTPDLSPSRRPLERTSSLSKPRPVSSYTAPPSPSQTTPPSFKPLSSPPTITPPPPPSLLYQDHASNKTPPQFVCPPPPPQITKPTWLPVQSHAIPMPTMPPPPPPPSVPPASHPDRLPGFFHTLPPFPKPVDAKFGNFRDVPPPPPPHFPSSFTPSLPAPVPSPPLPPPPKAHTVTTYRPAVPPLPPSYPCTAPSRRPPAVPLSAGAGRLAPPPAPPARSPSTELSSRMPPPLPPLPPAPPLAVRNGHLHSFDDFESKFQFHPVEDLPPPEVFRPFPRTYPSKENRVSSQAPGVRTHLR
ncbi:WAS/WASL-interacting protein family member 3 isoform 1-T2 [Clarias gariepinus]|uniref:WAS/WASL-interacting protein family member 3 n=1 Tax=Clarias gariepinus TaxID=13013 RepID=UPI00234DF26F|nr:WAS/WASL-interacting protein family member 3 [Clarias gariepinus]